MTLKIYSLESSRNNSDTTVRVLDVVFPVDSCCKCDSEAPRMIGISWLLLSGTCSEIWPRS